MSELLSTYRYSPLPLGSQIRLLRLLPHEDQDAPIQCQLFGYSLQELGRRTHPYEALSYAWGNPRKIRSISICGHDLQYNLPVTENLYEALSHLRYHSIERVLWVDAVCINQGNIHEKEEQVQSMAKIYAQANCVIVWLGKAADNSDRALEAIRAAGGKDFAKSSNNETIEQATIALLDRPWFRRIWVLQEVAAARNICIVCGFMEIDGYAFCSGLTSLKLSYEAHPELRSLILPVTYLIRGAIFRPKYETSLGRGSLNIRSLGELIDMYHTREATERHDKVYALLGMSSDDPTAAGLSPNYTIPWKQLFERLVKFLLCKEISVETQYDDGIAVIKSKGCIVGQVSEVIGYDTETVYVGFTFKDTASHSDNYSTWTLPASAKTIQMGDIVCLLQGALKPTIIRLCKDYFVVIVVAATPLDGTERLWRRNFSKSIKQSPRDFLLVWDWENTRGEGQDREEYETLAKTNNQDLEHPKAEFGDHSHKATRTWNVALILGDLGKHEEAEWRLQKAIEGYEIAIGEEHAHKLKSQYGLTPLLWAAGNGYYDVVKALLANNSIDPDLKDSRYGQTPISWAAQNGQVAMVKLLLETGQVEADSKDEYSQTPLLWAAKIGHDAVVKLLLGTGQVEADSKDRLGQTPLWWAACNGHDAVVKLLLETGQVEADSKNKYCQTPLSWAAYNGHDAVVKLLLETGQVEAELEDRLGETPLWWAACNGHDAVVKLLLGTGQVEADSKDRYGQTPLSWAACNGHDAVVKLLLETDQVEADSKDELGWTPLLRAAWHGHDTIVKLLLETGQVEADSKDEYSQTPLLWAAKIGHDAVVKLLLGTGQVEVDSKDGYGQTPLLWAAKIGHDAVVKLLLETGQVETDSKDEDGHTVLWWAARNRHDAIVKLLEANMSRPSEPEGFHQL